MSIVSKIIKKNDKYIFYYGLSIAEGRFMVQSKALNWITAEQERILKIEHSANRLYGYYGQGYYKGRFAILKPVLEDIFLRTMFFMLGT